jgi:hypothetical protein
MKLTKWITPVFAATLMVAAAACSSAQYGPPPGGPPPGYQQGGGRDGDWQNAPPEFREWQQKGFRDGIEGARKDFENHRRFTPNNRDEFRHPNAPGPFRRDYKDGFRRGYQVGVQHMTGGPGPRPY